MAGAVDGKLRFAVKQLGSYHSKHSSAASDPAEQSQLVTAVSHIEYLVSIRPK